MDFQLWVLNHGFSIMGYQLWVVNHGLPTMVSQSWAANHGLLTMVCKSWILNYGLWTMGSITSASPRLVKAVVLTQRVSHKGALQPSGRHNSKETLLPRQPPLHTVARGCHGNPMGGSPIVGHLIMGHLIMGSTQLPRCIFLHYKNIITIFTFIL